MRQMKIFRRLISIFLTMIIGGLIFLSISPDYNIYLVRSESMKPAINIGDVIITGPIQGFLSSGLKPGEVVTYKRGKGMVTHRVLSLDGDKMVTKGDAAEDPDPWSVRISDLHGIYLFKIPKIGYLFNFLQSRVGWFLIIIFPSAVLVALLVKDIVKEALSGDNADKHVTQ
jgi:signal peptidase